MASVFSGGAGRRASIAQGQILKDGKDEAFGYLDRGQDMSLSSLGRGFGQARSDISAGTRGALNSLDAGYESAADSLAQGYVGANSYLGQAAGLYDPLIGTANKGYNLYADATGVNGNAGADRARTAFQTGPGYQWQVNQATDAAARKAAALGIAGSGNTMSEIATLGSNLANQEYGNWLNRLQGWQALAPQLAGAKASILGNQATLADNFGRGRADLVSNYTRGRAGVLSGEGTSLADLSRGLGTAEAGVYSNTAGNKAQTAVGVADKLGEIVSGGMMAGQNAAANRLNFGMQLGQLGASLLGGASGGGGGGLLSGLAGLFK